MAWSLGAIARTVLVAGAVLSASDAGAQRPAAAEESDLLTWMTGAFTTDAQAHADEAAGRTVHERLRIVTAPLRFGGDAPPGDYLYAEHAPLNRLHRPTAQLVYRIATSGPRTVLEHWSLGNARPFVTAHSSAELRGALRFASLAKIEGCDVELTREGDSYRGRTAPLTCRGLARDAFYAEIELDVTQDGWTVVERGFDKDGTLRWGTSGDDRLHYRRQEPLEASRPKR